MFIKLPIIKHFRTELEDVPGEEFNGTAVINTDNVEFFYGDSDTTCSLFFTSGASVVVIHTEDELESVFDQYEIKIYDN